jgi:hypothetical protein
MERIQKGGQPFRVRLDQGERHLADPIARAVARAASLD